MKVRRLLDSRLGYLFTAVFLLAGVVAPGLMPAFVSAGTLTSRSITMSSSKSSDTGVTYTITFTPTQAAQTLVVGFCTSPIINDSSGCTAVPGLSVASATIGSDTGGGGLGTIATSEANHVLKYTPSTAFSTAARTIVLNNVTNPSGTPGTFYARIMTFGTTFSGYSTIGATNNTPIDSGGVAMSTTSPIAVTATVKETLLFCVSKTALNANCASASSSPPNVALGTGNPAVIDFTGVYTNDNYAQITTNASSGATVAMKTDSGVTCGGLKRLGVSTCDIPASGVLGAIAAGDGKIGVRVSTGTGTTATGATNSIGALSGTAAYASGSQYALNDTEVISASGTAIMNTASAPVSNKNQQMTWAATASTSTPAGNYSQNYYLIATGTF